MIHHTMGKPSRNAASGGVSDIAYSERSLAKFSTICRILRGREARSEQKKLLEAIKSRAVLTRKAVERHLSIMNHWKLVESRYSLIGDGKAVAEFSLRGRAHLDLSLPEKILFFKALFTTASSPQLLEMLRSINVVESGDRSEIVVHFFKTTTALQVWGPSAIERGLVKYRDENKISSFFQNKFGCMLGWLYDVDFLELNQDRTIRLSDRGRQTFESMESSKTPSNNIYGFSAQLLGLKVNSFRLEVSSDNATFRARLLEAYDLFGGKHGLADYFACSSYVCTNLLAKDNLLIEDLEFRQSLAEMTRNGTVRSIMMGTQGKPAYFTLQGI